MSSDKVFQFALAASLVTHGVIVFQNVSPLFAPESPKERKIEVKYLKQSAQAKGPRAQAVPRMEPFRKLPETVTANQNSPPSFPAEKSPFKAGKVMMPSGSTFSKPSLAKPDLISIKKKISLPAVDMDKSKINNPSYISYYQLVREKIRRSAYQNYTRTETGEAYLSFVVAREGGLEDVHVIDERSSQDSYLQATALKSIRESAPFPAFPKDLNYPRLSFNVVISFEVE
ncbi:MAG: TonB family protein [Candidatus Omnitrophica bacterium]|nr:TonB family protein [Candidatus Omnitrophota bacterium]